MTTHGQRWAFLPRIGTPAYYVLLAVVAMFVLGPLGGITASYMCFSLGFFVGGQVLAGILGSVVTFGYGPEGKHGANYMQTMAASVATMSGMGVLLQAMVWLGLPEPPAWQLVLYFLCIGMFGVGVGMLYTPILVDKLQLTYPSGLAVANILRALTDLRLLKRSVGQLAGGMGVGFVFPLLLHVLGKLGPVAALANTGVGTSTIGAGMIVGARITVPAVVYGIGWYLLTPWLRVQGWLGEHDPPRKFAFVVALGTIMGAAIVDIALLFVSAVRTVRSRSAVAQPVGVEPWQRTNTTRTVLWLAVWSVALVVVASAVLHVPAGWIALAIALVFAFMMVNGISQGITDQNPISSAFVVSIVIMAGLGLKEPIVALFAGSILLVACAVGVDMQQDRSTGWRLGTPRTLQFRFQVVGVVMGAVLAVVLAKLFMQAYPVLLIDAHAHPEQADARWQSAMTYKFAGAVRSLVNPTPWQIPAMLAGVAFGFVAEGIRKLVKGSTRWQAWSKTKQGGVADFLFDAVLVPSPYASSFAGFVELGTSLWWGAGGAVSSAINAARARPPSGAAAAEDTLPEGALPDDMSTTSLVGGGLIAGDALAALVIGLVGLLALVGGP